ncbi:MAG TPA: serine hydrolase domain-containing protein [Chitinophagaceae bacterium]|nr:serine hydrolase domain-containing protein [Chitinophagaceae bacterium]
MKKLFYPIVVVILFGCSYSSPKSTPPKAITAYNVPTPKGLPEEEFQYYSKLARNHFEGSLLKRGFNGQILIAKNGTIVYQKTVGFADMRTKDSLDSRTPMHIASISKTFTGMAILHLMEQGSLKLDDTLGKFFPAFPYEGITVKMLLSHRSGLPNYLHYLSEIKVKDTCYSNQDVLASLYAIRPNPETKPDRRFNYSNTNYVLLALIIEKVTGESFPAYLKKTFFTPLQMTNTFVYANQDTLTPTPSFQWTGRFWDADPFDCTYGDKNIYSTSEDLLKWDQALSSGQLFKKETLDSAFTPLSNERRSIHNYGLGWRMMIFPNGKKFVYHNGRWHGSNAVFVRFADENATMIIIGNKYNSNIYNSARKAYNLFGSYTPDSNNKPDYFNEDSENSVVESATNLLEPARKAFSSKTR